MKNLRIYLVVFGISLFSCDGNYREVVISGQVRDSLTGQPVGGSQVNIVCWAYDTKVWESVKIIKDTLTDARGNFSIPFEKSEAIDVEVSHPGYEPYKFSRTLDRNINKIDLLLKKQE